MNKKSIFTRIIILSLVLVILVGAVLFLFRKKIFDRAPDPEDIQSLHILVTEGSEVMYDIDVDPSYDFLYFTELEDYIWETSGYSRFIATRNWEVTFTWTCEDGNIIEHTYDCQKGKSVLQDKLDFFLKSISVEP